MSQLVRALYISRKDVQSYYGKPPLITWGLLFPAVLMLAVYVKDPSTYLECAAGIIGMTLLFGNTSMAAIVITFEKRSGTLERLLLAPISDRTIIWGKAASAAAYGIATALVLSGSLSVLMGMHLARPGFFFLALGLGGATFALMGLAAASLVREVFEAMTLMNFFRFPILFFSGVFVGIESLPAWVKPLALASPLTYVVELLRVGIAGRSAFSSPLIPILVSVGFLVVSCWLAVTLFARRRSL